MLTGFGIEREDNTVGQLLTYKTRFGYSFLLQNTTMNDIICIYVLRFSFNKEFKIRASRQCRRAMIDK